VTKTSGKENIKWVSVFLKAAENYFFFGGTVEKGGMDLQDV
jgi:hypothetical protein